MGRRMLRTEIDRKITIIAFERYFSRRHFLAPVATS